MQKPLILISIVLFMSAVSVPGQEMERKCKVTFLMGRVEVQKSDNQWKPVRMGQSLAGGSSVRTFVESKLQITTEEGTVLTVDENTMLRLRSLLKDEKTGNQKSEVDIRVGKVLANVKKLSSRRSSFVFETPVATAAIRGTELELDVTNAETKIKVFEGLVQIAPISGGNGASVGASEMALVRKGQSRVVVRKLENSELQKLIVPSPQVQGDTAATKDSTAKDTTALRDTTAGIGSAVSPAAPASPGQAATSSSLAAGTDSGAPQIDLPALPAYVETGEYVLSGKVSPGARVRVNGVEGAAGTDGTFRHVISLKPGANAIAFEAAQSGRTIRKQANLEYRPPLRLSVANLVDGASLTSPSLDVAVQVSEGARFSINGMSPGVRTVTLRPGPNAIHVRAYDRWGRSEEQNFTVHFDQQQQGQFFLNVVTPAHGTIPEPRVVISGSTVPGAIVTVQDNQITVGPGGSFSHTIYLADESASYEIAIRASNGASEKTEVRRISYSKPKIPLSLTVISPVQNARIRSAGIAVSGLAKGAVEVRANGRPLSMDLSGRFSGTIPVLEKDIGDFTAMIVAGNGSEEVSHEVRVTIDATSPEINTSVPRIAFVTASPRVTRAPSIAIMLSDNTADDHLVLTAELNGEITTLEERPGGRTDLPLSPGSTRYKISAKDVAGNISNVLSGEILSLPRSPVISLRNPDTENFRVEGIPPSSPGGRKPMLPVEVEIDDNVGDNPRNIRSVRAISASGTILLNQQMGYNFQGQVPLRPGNNRIEIVAEDAAGNVTSKVLNVLWRD